MYVFVVDIYLLIIVLESKSSVTVKLLPIVTSLGKPTVKVLFAVKSWAPVGETSTSLDVPANLLEDSDDGRAYQLFKNDIDAKNSQVMEKYHAHLKKYADDTEAVSKVTNS